jgi:hypothetical protein
LLLLFAAAVCCCCLLSVCVNVCTIALYVPCKQLNCPLQSLDVQGNNLGAEGTEHI